VTFLHAVSEKELNTVLGSAGVNLPIVPTTDGGLRTCSSTYFNDLGPQASEVSLPPGHSIASDYVDRNLAQKLGLSFLSDRISTLDGEGLMEMKEDLTTRVSNVLQSYTKEQAFMEALANAADAGATKFGVTLDIKQHPPLENQQFISHDMKKLCCQPSLILHNNGVFSSSDWKGICNVGSGSKQGCVGGEPKIGRFGLGALSMFYFTEVLLTSTIHEHVLTPLIQGHNDIIWLLCPVHGSQESIPWKGSFMLQSILGNYEEVCQSLFEYAPYTIYMTSQVFPHTSYFTAWPLWL